MATSLNTIHLYYDDTEQFTCEASVIGKETVTKDGKKEECLILNRTVMHPQGGQLSWLL